MASHFFATLLPRAPEEPARTAIKSFSEENEPEFVG
jgi:hypothetical protein